MAAFEFGGKLFLAGEDKSAFGSEELLTFAENGVADEGLILIGAQDDAERGIVVRATLQVVKHADIHVHLADVFVGEFFRLQINEDEALEQVVVENEVHVEVAALGADAELATNEGEALAQLH